MNLLEKAMKKAATVESTEIRATLLSFGFVLALTASTYILRPIRDAMSSNWSDAETSTLFTMTFVASALAVFLYGAACGRVRIRKLVPGVYLCFALSFLTFYVIRRTTAKDVFIDKSLFVWVSVYSLFNVSVFWTLMAEIFSSDQAKRLFGFIASGASIGAIVGPLVAVVLVRWLGVEHLLLVPSVLLLLPLPIIKVLDREEDGGVAHHPREARVIGGNPFAGFTLFLSRPFLLGIGLFMSLYTTVGTLIYFELKNLLIGVPEASRVQVWSGVDLAVNVLSVATAVFGTGRLARRFGLTATLGLVPTLLVGGMLAVAAAPMLWVVVGIQVFNRAGSYAGTRDAVYRGGPGTRFKAKSVIDILVYRGGDTFAAWAFTGLTKGLGLGAAHVALIGAGLAVLWAAVGGYLGRAYTRQGQTEDGVERTAGTALVDA